MNKTSLAKSNISSYTPKLKGLCLFPNFVEKVTIEDPQLISDDGARNHEQFERTVPNLGKRHISILSKRNVVIWTLAGGGGLAPATFPGENSWKILIV